MYVPFVQVRRLILGLGQNGDPQSREIMCVLRGVRPQGRNRLRGVDPCMEDDFRLQILENAFIP